MLVMGDLREKIIFDKCKDLKEAENGPCRFLDEEDSRPKHNKCKKPKERSMPGGG